MFANVSASVRCSSMFTSVFLLLDFIRWRVGVGELVHRRVDRNSVQQSVRRITNKILGVKRLKIDEPRTEGGYKVVKRKGVYYQDRACHWKVIDHLFYSVYLCWIKRKSSLLHCSHNNSIHC